MTNTQTAARFPTPWVDDSSSYLDYIKSANGNMVLSCELDTEVKQRIITAVNAHDALAAELDNRKAALEDAVQANINLAAENAKLRDALTECRREAAMGGNLLAERISRIARAALEATK